MASEIRGSAGFAVAVALRATLAGVLAFAAAWAASRHLFATALVLAGAVALVGLDLYRRAAAADRLLAQFVDGLAAEGAERPISTPGLGRLGLAVDRALDRLAAARAERQQRADVLQALIDNVAAALLVTDEAGRVISANRAARRTFGEAAGPLAAIPAIGPQNAASLMRLPPGGREILRLAEGRAMLAQVAVFSTPESGRRRLIALQGVSGELDAVEVKAWQDLVRVLAHEMMNSLTVVCSLAESIGARLEDGDRELAEAARVIVRRSAGLMSFVGRYRQVADLPAPEKTRLAMKETVARLDRLAAAMIGEAAIDYASAVQPAGLVLAADADLLEQALINLLKNAVDAVRGRAGARIRLTCRAEGDSVLIAVADNGPGLAADDPEAVFVPFFTTKAGGSGVGLTLSRQIALAHGGRLDHEPAPGGGAVFRLVLPRA